GTGEKRTVQLLQAVKQHELIQITADRTMPVDASRPEHTEIGAYDVIAKVAEGGMGTVYKARRRDDGQIVAIKIIPPGAARTPVLMQRFKREFNAARQIDHPNVVK